MTDGDGVAYRVRDTNAEKRERETKREPLLDGSDLMLLAMFFVIPAALALVAVALAFTAGLAAGVFDFAYHLAGG